MWVKSQLVIATAAAGPLFIVHQRAIFNTLIRYVLYLHKYCGSFNPPTTRRPVRQDDESIRSMVISCRSDIVLNFSFPSADIVGARLHSELW
jgi:hypothetical protein